MRSLFRSDYDLFGGAPLGKVVSTLSETQCSDPRDRIFAFLSLASDTDEIVGFHVDYAQSLEKLYAKMLDHYVSDHSLHKRLHEIFNLTYYTSCDASSQRRPCTHVMYPHS